jgi:hypothetical protein
MPTTVHVPPALLKSVDQRAKALGLSRNRLVVRALERVVNDRSGWAPEFLHQLRHPDSSITEAVDRLVDDVTLARRSKRPPVL